jgi:hypothetical protein
MLRQRSQLSEGDVVDVDRNDYVAGIDAIGRVAGMDALWSNATSRPIGLPAPVGF